MRMSARGTAYRHLRGTVQISMTFAPSADSDPKLSGSAYQGAPARRPVRRGLIHCGGAVLGPIRGVRRF